MNSELFIYNPQEFNFFNDYQIREIKYDTREYQIEFASNEYKYLTTEITSDMVEEIITNKALNNLHPYIQKDLGTHKYEIVASDKFYFHINQRIQFRFKVQFRVEDYHSNLKRIVCIEKKLKHL